VDTLVLSMDLTAGRIWDQLIPGHCRCTYTSRRAL